MKILLLGVVLSGAAFASHAMRPADKVIEMMFDKITGRPEKIAAEKRRVQEAEDTNLAQVNQLLARLPTQPWGTPAENFAVLDVVMTGGHVDTSPDAGPVFSGRANGSLTPYTQFDQATLGRTVVYAAPMISANSPALHVTAIHFDLKGGRHMALIDQIGGHVNATGFCVNQFPFDPRRTALLCYEAMQDADGQAYLQAKGQGAIFRILSITPGDVLGIEVTGARNRIETMAAIAEEKERVANNASCAGAAVFSSLFDIGSADDRADAYDNCVR
jgi:hypothetical protein